MATILLRTLILYLTISLVLRSMGKRQVGELELSDLVATLLLSEVAALPIADRNTPLLHALIPLLLILSLEILLTYLKNKWGFLKRLLEGRPSFLITRGQLDQKELLKLRISIDELLGECRLQGYSDLSEIEYAILEQDGKLSLFPKATEEPVKVSDLGLQVPAKGIAHPVITDGCIETASLSLLGITPESVRAICRQNNCRAENVLLMTINDTGDVNIIKKEEKQ